MIRSGALLAIGVMLATSGVWAGDSPARREDKTQVPAGAAGPGLGDRDSPMTRAIARFVDIERFARLPDQQREAQIPGFYREMAPPCMTPMVDGIISSFPADLFQQGGSLAPEDNHIMAYGRQLDDAATTMSPPEMAEAIFDAHGRLILSLATKVRSVQILERHKAQVKKLIEEDLNSDDLAAVRRACSTIHNLRLKDFNKRLLKTCLADGKFATEARSAIIWLNDPELTDALIADIEKNPAALRRHHGLLNGMLWGRAANGTLVKLLESADADIRCWAALAIQDCVDPSLAPHVTRLLGDKDARVKHAAAHMAGRLPGDVFPAVRSELTKLLAAGDLELCVEAAQAFAEHKDIAGARALLDLWQQPLPEGMKVRVMQAVNRMAGGVFGYDMHQWAQPTANNMRAISQFELWIVEQETRAPGR